MTRSDPSTRWKNYTVARSHGIMTSNEIRQLENLDPRPDGDTLTPPAVTPKPAGNGGDQGEQPAPASDKVARLDQHRVA